MLEKNKQVDHDNILQPVLRLDLNVRKVTAFTYQTLNSYTFGWYYRTRISLQDKFQVGSFHVCFSSLAEIHWLSDGEPSTAKKNSMLEKKKHIDHDNMLETSASTRSKCMSSNSVHIPGFCILMYTRRIVQDENEAWACRISCNLDLSMCSFSSFA